MTHYVFNPVGLSRHYPRGGKALKNIFKTYHAEHTVAWFASKGVQLKTEPDGRMFPVTDQSQTIIDCFMQEAHSKKIRIELNAGVEHVAGVPGNFEMNTASGTFRGKRILVAVGGNPGVSFYQWIAALGHTIIPPIPSLFTFNDPEKKFADLMGVSVPGAEVRIAGTRFSMTGPVLITHWGLSGPAVIRLSAWAAAYLHERNYQFTVLVSWLGQFKEEALRRAFEDCRSERQKQKVKANPRFDLPLRLWQRLCDVAGVEDDRVWGELPNRILNRLVELLIRCQFKIAGKTTFKEEFVTCGGVDLNEIDFSTMESRRVPGLYFAGEVLNIDGETGGFNFQAAWTTGYIAAKAIVGSLGRTD